MNCNSCGSYAIGSYLFTRNGEILKCRSCGLVVLAPEGREDRLDVLYSQDYFTDREGYFFRDGVIDGSGVESPHIADFRAGLAFIEIHAGSPGTLLDVGCATGSFLTLAAERGWVGHGVEVSEFAAAKARERTGLEIFCGPFGDAPFVNETFDVVTMWDLLEHLPVPLEALQKAYSLLKPSGLLLVNTPNENSLIRKMSRFLYRASGGTIKGPVNRLYHPYHFCYFGAETLARLFDKAGFDIIGIQTKEIPLSRGRISPAVKVMVRVLGLAARLLHAEYELIVLARKRAN